MPSASARVAASEVPSSGPAPPLCSDRRAAALVVLAVVAALAGVLFLGTEALVHSAYFWDDEFYYFQIARNVGAGRGFTFDGIHQTNGFQPLWLLLLVPVFRLPGDDLPLRAVALLEIALVALAAVRLLRVLQPRLGQAPALAAALLLVAQPGATKVFRVGMESSLLLCLLVLAWERWLRVSQDTRPRLDLRWLELGGWCALAFLTRLEAAVLLPLMLLFSRRQLRARPWAAACLVAPPALCAAAYLAWNRIAFDLWLPVSGLVKAHWAWVEGPWMRTPGERLLALLRVQWAGDKLVQHVLGHPFRSLAASALNLLLLGAVGVAAWRGRHRLRQSVAASGTGFLLAVAATMLIADKLAMRHLMADWHNVPLYLGTAVLGGVALHRAPRLSLLAVAGMLLVCLARAPLVAWYAREPNRHVIAYVLRSARWLREQTPDHERVATWRWGGILGYFSHRAVTVLDGLPGDADFFRQVVREGKIEEYLRRERVVFLGAPVCGPVPSFAEAFPPIHLPAPVRARLEPEFALAASFHDARHGCPGYALWKAHLVPAPSDAIRLWNSGSPRSRSSSRRATNSLPATE